MAVRDDVVNAIAAFSLFADLSGPQLEEVAHLFDESFFAKGEPPGSASTTSTAAR